jgi:hypothetical protein
MKRFEIITEFGSPIAALVSAAVDNHQLNTIYALLTPGDCYNQPALAKRWAVNRVLATDAWAAAQLKRRPMLKPPTLKLAFL